MFSTAIDKMTEQINSVVTSTSSVYTTEGSEYGGSSCGDWDEELFSQDDLRGELNRLKDGLSGTTTLVSSQYNRLTAMETEALCLLPDAAPAAPVGFRVTKEMENVREILLLGSQNERVVTVCGMGGAQSCVLSP